MAVVIFNTTMLKKLQGVFLSQYPQGFNDPEMLAIVNKHKMSAMIDHAQEWFSKPACEDVDVTVDNIIKIVSRSSMVSRFEKPKFRDFINRLSPPDKTFLVDSLVQLLHGQQNAGFDGLVDLFRTEKLAKWSLVTIIPAYYSPNQEVFVKPTTAKRILSHFEVTDPVYQPLPSWDFYQKYRKLINSAKMTVNHKLSPSNAAFSGFLMTAIRS